MVKSKGSCFERITFASNTEDSDEEIERLLRNDCNTEYTESPSYGNSLVPTSIYYNTHLATPQGLIKMTQNIEFLATEETIDVSHWARPLTTAEEEDEEDEENVTKVDSSIKQEVGSKKDQTSKEVSSFACGLFRPLLSRKPQKHQAPVKESSSLQNQEPKGVNGEAVNSSHEKTG